MRQQIAFADMRQGSRRRVSCGGAVARQGRVCRADLRPAPSRPVTLPKPDEVRHAFQVEPARGAVSGYEPPGTASAEDAKYLIATGSACRQRYASRGTDGSN